MKKARFPTSWKPSRRFDLVYGIIGEAKSDAATLKVLVQRLAKNSSLTIRTKGYAGCGQMLRDGARQIRQFADDGLTRFIVAYDADNHSPAKRREQVMREIVRPSRVNEDICCVVIPVQEIEAWILADVGAVQHVLSSWKTKSISQSPESIENPKEHLARLGRGGGKKPFYDHTTHNVLVAEHLRLDVVRRKCPSFATLSEFVTEKQGRRQRK
jgi:hypothetical protein